MKIGSPDPAALAALTWQGSEVPQAIDALAEAAGFLPKGFEPSPIAVEEPVSAAADISRRIETAARRLGLEAEEVTTTYAEVNHYVSRLGPGLLFLPPKTEVLDVSASQRARGENRFLVLLRGNRQRVTLIAPNRSLHSVPTETVRAALCGHLEARQVPAVARVSAEAGIASERRRRKVTQLLLDELLGTTPIRGGWLLKMPPGRRLWQEARSAHLLADVLLLVAVFSAGYALLLGSRWLIGRDILRGHVQFVWIMAWTLLLVTTVPFQTWNLWLQGKIVSKAGALFKTRLLESTFWLGPDEVRLHGAGQFLSQVMDAEAVELLALGGGFQLIFALGELIAAVIVLRVGALPSLHIGLLAAWALVCVALGVRYWRQSQAWLASHRALTNHLVEQMIGHRTRLAQGNRAAWHDAEDRQLARYQALSAALDQAHVLLVTAASRGWFLLALAAMVVYGPEVSAAPGRVVISLGGILLAGRALDQLVVGFQRAVELFLGWQQVGPMVLRPRGLPIAAPLAPPIQPERSDGAQPLLIARRLYFRYPGRTRPVLRNCQLHIYPGDRLLLTGASGSGKSTLVSLLSSLREPESGLLLLWGLDQRTVGSRAWRRRVAAVHQFHENHVLTETLAFNLLMGRGWPPTPEDLAEAEAVCRELGLGPMIDRMPLGLQQIVGESGWQLSHGERSRLFVARGLLQRADLLILDESLTGLDPESTQQAMRCILNRAPALLLVAHA